MAIGLYLQSTDFEGGKYAISQNQFSSVDSFIEDTFVSKWIRTILGATEGDAFIADLDANGNPQTAKYIAINGRFDFEYGGCPYSSIGIKEIIQMLFFSMYTSQQSTFNQTSGNAHVAQEATNPDNFKPTLMYNRAVSEMRLLSCYLADNTDTYTDYKDGGVFNLSFDSLI